MGTRRGDARIQPHCDRQRRHADGQRRSSATAAAAIVCERPDRAHDPGRRQAHTPATPPSTAERLQLNNGNGANGNVSSPGTITVNAGGLLALNAGDKTLGYTAGRDALIINRRCRIQHQKTSASRDTIANTITMTGGTLTGTGVGDADGSYSIFSPAGSNGNHRIRCHVRQRRQSGAVVDATYRLALQGPVLRRTLFVVNRGPANPPADMIVTRQTSFTFGNNLGPWTSRATASFSFGRREYLYGGATVSGGTMQLGPGTPDRMARSTTSAADQQLVDGL